MTTDVVQFPAGIYPDVQRLTPDRGQGQSVLESPFNGAQQVQTYRGAERWRLELGFSSLRGDDRADMMAFVTRLRISHNTFLIVQHTAPQRGVRSGTPLILGSMNGHYAVLYNLGTNISSYFRAGDFCAVNSQLKMVLEDVGTNGSGVCSAHIWPPLYDCPDSGTIVLVNSPCGGFRLVDVVGFDTNPPSYLTNMTLTAIERMNSSMLSDFL